MPIGPLNGTELDNMRQTKVHLAILTSSQHNGRTRTEIETQEVRQALKTCLGGNNVLLTGFPNYVALPTLKSGPL